jgi:hypothetical protein
VMIAAYAGMTIYDYRCMQAGEAPSWFMLLRLPVTIAAVLSLLAGIILLS